MRLGSQPGTHPPHPCCCEEQADALACPRLVPVHARALRPPACSKRLPPWSGDPPIEPSTALLDPPPDGRSWPPGRSYRRHPRTPPSSVVAAPDQQYVASGADGTMYSCSEPHLRSRFCISPMFISTPRLYNRALYRGYNISFISHSSAPVTMFGHGSDPAIL